MIFRRKIAKSEKKMNRGNFEMSEENRVKKMIGAIKMCLKFFQEIRIQ